MRRATTPRSAALKWSRAAAGLRPGRPAPRTVYKIYAESFKDEAHLDAIVSEAQRDGECSARLQLSSRARGNDMNDNTCEWPCRRFRRNTAPRACCCTSRRCPRRYGIGDLGPAALAWIDRLHEAGQSWWQALPLGPTGYGNSPYQSLSSFAGNELLISPDGLIEDGLLRASDCEGQVASGISDRL